MDWFEELPTECPPSEAVSTEGYLVYRLVATEPPTEADFKSHRMLFPEKKFHVSECQAHSLSVFDNIEATEKALLLPTLKGKLIHTLTLNENDGLILQTTTNIYHFSWWRTNNFKIQ